MFIERLTEQQIKDFLDEQYGKDYFKYEFTHNNESERIVGTVKCLHDSKEYDSFWLCDFKMKFGLSLNSNDWLRYLYKIFGEEYKEAYLAECTKVFE